MITTRDQLIAAMADSWKCRFYKASVGSATAGIIMSWWKSAGFPTVGTTPTTAVACDNTITGAFPLPTVTTELLYIGKLAASCTTAGQLILFDRLSHMGGLSGTSTSAQTVNLDVATASAAGRCGTDGKDVLWCLEWYTATGSTAVTATITYTNQADTTGRTTTVSLAASRPAGCLLPILPNSSDIRIKSIQSVTLSATTGTAGNFGVSAITRQVEVPMVSANIGAVLDYAGTCMEQVKASSCLMLGFVPSTTSTGNVLGSFEILKG